MSVAAIARSRSFRTALPARAATTLPHARPRANATLRLASTATRLTVAQHAAVSCEMPWILDLPTSVRAACIFIGLPLFLAARRHRRLSADARNLAPLQSMAAQARRITGSNLDTRLEIGDAAEELAVLAASFNELLARLDQSFETHAPLRRRRLARAAHAALGDSRRGRRGAHARRIARGISRGAGRHPGRIAPPLPAGRRSAQSGARRRRPRRSSRSASSTSTICWPIAAARCRAWPPRARSPRVPRRRRHAVLRRRGTAAPPGDQSARQCDPLHAARAARSQPTVEAEAHGVRLRVSDTGDRHRAGRRAARLRALLPRGQGPVARRRRLRPRTLDREVDRGIASRRGRTRSEPAAGSTFTVTLPR